MVRWFVMPLVLALVVIQGLWWSMVLYCPVKTMLGYKVTYCKQTHIVLHQ